MQNNWNRYIHLEYLALKMEQGSNSKVGWQSLFFLTLLAELNSLF